MRELPRIINELRDHPERLVLKDIPREYTLGAGHCKFFRNKLKYLANRHMQLLVECSIRGINVDQNLRVDLYTLPDHIQLFCCNNWTPTKQDHSILIDRLKERFQLRGKAYHLTENNCKIRIDCDDSFGVYYVQKLAKYLD